jgi:hypothetical protein
MQTFPCNTAQGVINPSAVEEWTDKIILFVDSKIWFFALFLHFLLRYIVSKILTYKFHESFVYDASINWTLELP